jgi:hypothetical protein
MVWIKAESFRIRSPAFAHELVWSEAVEGSWASGPNCTRRRSCADGCATGHDRPNVAFNRGILGSIGHALAPTIRPG